MATDLGHGLVGFERGRIGLRAPSGPYSPAGGRGECSIHHGGPSGPPPRTFAATCRTLRSWQAFHMGKGWNDVGYNLAMDGLGRLYRLRPVGALPAAVGNHNSGTFALVFVQDGRRYPLNAAQREALRVLFEYGAPRWGVPPLRSIRVRTHREYAGHATNECPGDLIQRHVRWRRGRY